MPSSFSPSVSINTPAATNLPHFPFFLCSKVRRCIFKSWKRSKRMLHRLHLQPMWALSWCLYLADFDGNFCSQNLQGNSVWGPWHLFTWCYKEKKIPYSSYQRSLKRTLELWRNNFWTILVLLRKSSKIVPNRKNMKIFLKPP